jgi:hypothetical protein
MGPGRWLELRIHTLEPGTVVEQIDVRWYCDRGDF